MNRRALRKYGEFWRALVLVGNALAEAERVAAKATDHHGRDGGPHWSAPTAEELRAAAKRAGDALHVMSSSARKWEAELVSREWRR
ncbi:MAG: hypothetical protein AB7R99_28120 [Pseudonocardia sp.]